MLTRGRLLVSISFSMLHLLWALLATRVAWVLLILQVVLCQFRRMLAAVMLRSRVIVVLRRCEIAVLVILVSATWHWWPVIYIVERARIVGFEGTSRGVATRRRLIHHLGRVGCALMVVIMASSPIWVHWAHVPARAAHISWVVMGWRAMIFRWTVRTSTILICLVATMVHCLSG